MAARARRRQNLVRGSSALAILATLGVVGVVARVALKGRSLTPRAAAAAVVVDHGDNSDNGDSAVPKPATPPVVTAAPTVITPPIAPVVPHGQSALADSVLATRTDSGIVVWFDRTMIRTRNPQKFERFVRSTLPALYGPVADSALRRIPDGGLAQQGDLINDLPTRGLRIPVAPGWTFSLFPITRPGHDGPLVTQYRVSVIRG